MANVDNPHGFRFWKRLAGGAAEMYTGLLASNQIYTTGDVLCEEAGYIKIATAVTDAIIGVAVSSNATSLGTHPKVTYCPSKMDYMFTAQCSGTPTQATVGTLVDFEGTTGIMEINENASSVDHLRVHGFKPSTSIGLNAELIVTWNKSMWAQTASA